MSKASSVALLAIAILPSVLSAQTVELKLRGTFASNTQAGSEIVAHDPVTQRLFVTNGAANRIDVVNVANVDAPVLASSIDIAPFGGFVNSVAVKNGLVAAAIANTSATTPGVVVVFGTDGTLKRIFQRACCLIM